MAHSSLRLMYQSFYRHPPALHRGFPSLAAACRECVTRRESARIFFPSALGGTFLRFSSALSSLAALCLFLFLRRQMLLTALTLMRSWSSPLPASRCSSRLFLPPPLPPSSPADPSSSKKTRSRYTAALFARARRNHGFFMLADCSCIVAELTIIRSSVISRRDKVPRKNRVFQTRRLRPKYTHKGE